MDPALTEHERTDTDPDPQAGATRQILIVEDDADLADLLAVWLRSHYGDRADVHVAESVEAGTELLGSLSRLDVVLLDRQFPQGTGDHLLETIRSRFDTIVVMITGLEPESGLIRLPVTDYLVKPIDEATLVKRLALLEKLTAAGVLPEYTNARKASLLEYHLQNPESDPLYRRFASRWFYDRLEVVDTGTAVHVYELYLGADGARDADRIGVSVVGSLTSDLEELVGVGELTPVGELVPSGDGHAWLDIDEDSVRDPPADGAVIYGFTGEMPEQYVASGPADERIERLLEDAFA